MCCRLQLEGTKLKLMKSQKCLIIGKLLDKLLEEAVVYNQLALSNLPSFGRCKKLADLSLLAFWDSILIYIDLL